MRVFVQRYISRRDGLEFSRWLVDGPDWPEGWPPPRVGDLVSVEDEGDLRVSSVARDPGAGTFVLKARHAEEWEALLTLETLGVDAERGPLPGDDG